MARVLILDDAANCAEMAVVVCKAAGHEVVLARSGDHALERLQEEPFDLVLLGIYLPVRSGIDLMKAIKSDGRLNGIRLAVVTAQGDPEEHERFRAAGAEAVLLKPYSGQKLRQVLEQVLEQAA